MMMCDIMPTISEDLDLGPDGSVEDNNFEQLMVNMLDERDKLMETLRETQESLAYTRNKLKETELERASLLQQFDVVLTEADLDRDQLVKKLSGYESSKHVSAEGDSSSQRLKAQKWTLAEEFVTMAKDLFQIKERLYEREEEIAELKAERSNIKLLLEHLECLVSRHERSLRMTVVKRQAQTSAGVSSEVEVLKALKSLFEHHKALDEKVRERLRMALDKSKTLEEEVSLANQEIERLQDENKTIIERKHRVSVPNCDSGKISNGPVSETKEDLQDELTDMQYQLDQRNRELEKLRRECKDSKERISSLEEKFAMASRHLNSSQESSHKLHRDCEEALAQKADMEDRIITLEKRYVRSQNELASSSEDLERLKAEMKSYINSIGQKDDKISNLQEQLAFAEQKLTQSLQRVKALPKIEEELASRMAALNEAEERNFTAEERLQQLQCQWEEQAEEILLIKQRDKTTEEHNKKLQSQIDKLLSESNDRLQQHLKEKMNLIEDKKKVSQELDRLRQMLEDIQREKDVLVVELEKTRTEFDRFRSEVKADHGSASLIRTNNGEPLTDEQKVRRREERARVRSLEDDPSKILTINEHEWQKLTQASVISHVSHAFDQRVDSIKEETDAQSDAGSVYSSRDENHPSQVPKIDDAALENLTSGDAQHLANVLQQQLDAINQELAMLQVEHHSTKLRAEEIERHVGSETSSLDELSVSSSNPPSTCDSSVLKDKSRYMSEYEMAQRRKVENWNATNEPHPDPEDSATAFPFSSYDPSDTKPLMIKLGRSQERLEGGNLSPDTPGSLPSDSTESGETVLTTRGLTVPSWASYEVDRNSTYDFYSNPSSLNSSMESLSKRGSKRGLKSSLGKIFSSKSRLKSSRDPSGSGSDRTSEGGAELEYREAERRVKQKLLEDAINTRTSFGAWNAPTILAWLELWVKLPDWYIQACRANVKSGSIMSALSDTEIQHEIGVNNPLHRLKLRLAIHEMVNVTSPITPPTVRTSLIFGDMNHFWIAHEWIPSLGLAQYRNTFLECLVDARMLEHITRKEFQKYLKVVDGFHRNSIILATKCLEMLNYDRRVLERRRRECEVENKDVLVWSNDRIIRWISSIGLAEFSECLKQSGVHGSVIALDETFDVGSMTYFLQIPSTNTHARMILDREFKRLISLCPDRAMVTIEVRSELGDGDFKRTRSWRKKFKKDRTKEKSAKESSSHTLTRRGSAESDASQQSGSSGSDHLSSPAHRTNRRSPAIDRREPRSSQK